MDRLGVGFIRGLRPGEVVDCIVRAESLGYHSAWVAEGHGGDHFALLAAAALRTDRILLGTAVTSAYVRSAPTIAMAAATVDALSDGRFILGLGSSHRVQVVGEHGLPYSRPLATIRETVDVARALWRDGEVAYQGDTLALEGFDLWFPPQRPQIPIYLGALNPKMLRLAGEIADGIILTRATLDHVRSAIVDVERGRDDAGRVPGAIEIAALLQCAIAPDGMAARDRLRPGLAMYAARFPRYRAVMERAGFAEEVVRLREAWANLGPDAAAALVSDGLVDAISLAGSADDVRAKLSTYREAGVDLPIVSLAVDPANPLADTSAALEALAPG